MKQAKTLTDKELKLVLAHCATRRHAERDRAVVMVSFFSGLRAKEIAALKLNDVRAADGSLRAEFVLSAAQTKGGHARRVFLSTRLQRELGAYLNAVPLRSCCAALFRSQKGAAFSANTMCQLFLSIYQACGIDGASSHSGRRSFITNLAAKGVGVRALAALAGHASISTTQRYIDVNEVQMRNAVNLI